jgi:hypothetical protein
MLSHWCSKSGNRSQTATFLRPTLNQPEPTMCLVPLRLRIGFLFWALGDENPKKGEEMVENSGETAGNR